MHIYIPIWLDLLLSSQATLIRFQKDLHSNMVRFIINWREVLYALKKLFTFQYG